MDKGKGLTGAREIWRRRSEMDSDGHSQVDFVNRVSDCESHKMTIWVSFPGNSGAEE